MARILLCSVCVLVSLLLTGVKGQESEEEGGFWSRISKMIQNFMDSVRDAWKDLTTEIRARTTDMRGWTQELWDSFKQQLNDMVNKRNDISEDEKSDMKKYIERLEMPEEEKKE